MEPTPRFTGKLTLALNVRDRKASQRWYGKMFGFTLIYDVAEMKWCEITTSVPGVSIGFSEDPGTGTGGVTPTFEVADLDAARTALEGNGAAFDGPSIVLAGLAKLATLRDPDGNAVMLVQDLQADGA